MFLSLLNIVFTTIYITKLGFKSDLIIGQYIGKIGGL